MTHLRVLPLALALTAACAAGPASAAALTGALEARVADTFAGHGEAASSRTEAVLTTRDGVRHVLEPRDARAAEDLQRLSGGTARVVTDTDGDVGRATSAPGVRAAAAPSSMRLLAIIITPAGQTQDVTASQLHGRLFSDAGSVAAYLKAQAPSGLSLTGDVVGPYDVPAQTGCDEDQLRAQADSAAAAAGVSRSGYTHVMVYFPDQARQCGWAGLAAVNGGDSWVNGGGHPKVLAHEVGHNISLRHANSLACTTGAANVTLGATTSCVATEYGDPFSTMGIGTGTPGPTFSAQEREQLGWLGGPAYVGRSGDVWLDPVPTVTSGNARRVEFPISATSTASIELRTTSGFDTPLGTYGGTGMVAYLQHPPGFGTPGTFVLDARPETASLKDAALVPGETVPLGTQGASVTLLGSTALGANVRITPLPDATPPTAPAGVTARATSATSARIEWTPSTDDNRVRDYVVSMDGVPVSTVTTTNTTVSNVGSGPRTVTVVARDQSLNESAASAPVSIAVGIAPRFTAPITAVRTGVGNRDVQITVPPIDDSAGLATLTLLRNGQQVGMMSTALAGSRTLDPGQPAAATYVVRAVSHSGLTTDAAVTVARVGVGTAPRPAAAKTAPRPKAAARPALSGRLRLRCTVRGCTLTADRGTPGITRLRLQVAGKAVGARNGTLSVRVPRAMMTRLRVVRVTAFTKARVASKVYTVRLPPPPRLGKVVSGPLR